MRPEAAPSDAIQRAISEASWIVPESLKPVVYHPAGASSAYLGETYTRK